MTPNSARASGSHPPAIGIIPAAGMGARLQPFAYPKELLPITYQVDPSTRQARPRLIIHYSFDQMKDAGVSRVIVVVAPWKLELVRMLGAGMDQGMSTSFVVREVPRGLGDAIDAAYPWVGGSQVCLSLPDTIVSPRNSLAVVREEQIRSDADVVLGVFPTNTPEQLGPIRVSKSGDVLQVYEKPPRTDLRNTWGMAVWSPRFTDFLHRTLTKSDDKPTLGLVFQRAIDSGFRVRACCFDAGRYQDLGTPEALGVFIAEQSLAGLPPKYLPRR